MAEITRLKKSDAATLEQVNKLLRQLSGRIPSCTPELLKKIIANPDLELWIAREGKTVVGMAELAIVLKPEGIIAQIEDVVVDEAQRGKGIGKMLSEKLLERARARKARAVQLSSHPSREAGNRLYQKLGFEKWDTNFYRLKL